MSTCSCGEEPLAASAFTLVNHRLHGARACARHHTFGEVVRVVADGAHDPGAVVHALGDVDASLVGEALSRLRDAGILRPGSAASSRLALADGVESVAQAEEKLASSGTCLPGDYAA
jgi:hypothetical protein